MKDVKQAVCFYRELGLIACVLMGFTLPYVGRGRGLGIAAYYSALFSFFLTLLSVVYSNVMIRHKTQSLLMEMVIVVCSSFMTLSYFGLLLLFCVPQVVTFVPGADDPAIPLIMVYVSGALIVIIVVYLLSFVSYMNMKYTQPSEKKGKKKKKNPDIPLEEIKQEQVVNQEI